MRLSSLWPLAVVAVIAAGALMLPSVGAPKLGISQAAELRTPLPYPYDEKADAAKDVGAAFARARQSGKRVLIDFGGNWCSWCRILAGVIERPEMKPFMDAHYEMVSVDVGRTNRNLDVAAKYGAPKITGVPWIVIATPDGKILHSSYQVTDDNHTKPQQMADWLAKWAE